MTAAIKSPVKTGSLRAKSGLLRATAEPVAKAAPRRAGTSNALALANERERAGRVSRAPTLFSDPAVVFRLSPSDRIRMIKDGVPARHIDTLSTRMHTTKDALIDTLRLSRATLNRKSRAEQPLSQDESERVLGMEALIGQVQVMIEQAGDGSPFDAAVWVAAWLQRPVPALGGRKPAEFMDSVEGQKLVAHTLAMAHSGAYA